MAKKIRKRVSIKKILRLVIPTFVLMVLIFNVKRITIFLQSKITGYEYNTIQVFNELDIYADIRKHAYSRTIEVFSKSDEFEKKYLNEYLKIKYNDSDNDFITNVNTLLLLGYNANDINKMYDALSLDSIHLIQKNDYYGALYNILGLSYFHENDLGRYLEYAKNNELDYQDVVTYVNIGLDNDYYTNMVKIEKQDDPLVLVNKYHALNSNYVPNDLEVISSKCNKGYNNKLRHDARVAFEKMCEAALKDNIKIYSGSAYRSYSYQQNLYNRYVNQDGKAKADTYSARAGSSEHQTGLATDILNANLDFISASDKEFTWLVSNSYKYGYILRYPKGKEKITGYMYEEWHFRYVGVEVAKVIYDEDITYDEYVARR